MNRLVQSCLAGCVIALSCVLPGHVGADEIANSFDDWSPDGVQGENNWTHGWYNFTLDDEEGDGEYSVEEFIPFLNDESFEVTPDGLSHWDGVQWRLYRDGEDFGGGLAQTGPWTRVGEGNNPDFGHPNGANSAAPTEVDDALPEEHWVIRRWESNFTGSVEVTTSLAAQNANCGNGTTTHLFHNGMLVDTLESENDPDPVENTVALNIAAGDFLDYALTPVGPDGERGDSCDGSFYNMSVEGIAEGIVGDFNLNGELDLPDVNMLNGEIAAGSHDQTFDLNDDDLVNGLDLNVWVKDLRNTWFGDANLDSEFNSGDLVAVFAAGKYEVDLEAGWDEGDWNGDVRFNSGDLVAAFSDGGYEQGPRNEMNVVPEPTSFAMLIATLIGVTSVSRSRRKRV